MRKNPQAELDLAKSIILDIERSLFGRGLGIEKLEIAQTLLHSNDAKRLFHPDLISGLQGRIDDLQRRLTKKSEEDVGRLSKLREKYGRRNTPETETDTVTEMRRVYAKVLGSTQCRHGVDLVTETCRMCSKKADEMVSRHLEIKANELWTKGASK